VKRPLLAALAAAGLLAGCGTGLEAKTYTETGRTDGATADVGGRTGLAVRHLHVEGPALGSTFDLGGSVEVAGAFVNNSTKADSLLGATSDAAGSIVLLVDDRPVTSVPVPALGSSGTNWRIELVGLTRALHAGQFVTVTLSFARAGRVTLQVPVHAGDQGLDDREAEQDPYELPEE
jgi:periplasmic copper chaperone A